MKKLRYCLFCISAAVLASGCVHEFPEDPAVYPYMVDVALSLDIDMAFDQPDIVQTYSSRADGDYDIRYTVDIYVSGQTQQGLLSERLMRIVRTEDDIISKGVYRIEESLKLAPLKYEIVAWIDFVDKGSQADKYYGTENLQKIKILPQDGKYKGYSTTRDAFAGRHTMDLTPLAETRFASYDAVVPTLRPFALYRIVTTDITEYMTYHQAYNPTPYSSVRPSATNLAYELFLPTGYNSYLFAPDDFKGGVGYTFDIVEDSSDGEATLASDFVFMAENDGFYFADFEVVSAEGNRINVINGLKIPLRRNHITIVYSEFLTKDLNTDGGIGIDDGFDDEIIIEI